MGRGYFVEGRGYLVETTKQEVDISGVPPYIRAKFARQVRRDAESARLEGHEAEAARLEKEAAWLEGHEYDEKREVSEEYVKATLRKAGKKLSVKS